MAKIVLAPAAPAGVIAVIEVSELLSTIGASTLLIVSVAPMRLVPLTVIWVPPDVGPVDGLTPVIVGRNELY